MQLHSTKSVIHSPKQVVPTTANITLGFLSVSCYKAGCKLVSISHFHLFMSRRLQYLLRMCSTWLNWNLAQLHASWETSVVIIT